MPPGQYPADILGLYQDFQQRPIKKGSWTLILLLAVGTWGGFLGALESLGTAAPMWWATAAVAASFSAALRPDAAIVFFLLVSSSAPEAEDAVLRAQDLAIPVLVLAAWLRGSIIGVGSATRRVVYACLLVPSTLIVLDLLANEGKGVLFLGLRLSTSCALLTVPLMAQLPARQMMRTALVGTLVLVAAHGFWVFDAVSTSQRVDGPTGEVRAVFGATVSFAGIVGACLWLGRRGASGWLVPSAVLVAVAAIVLLSLSRTSQITLALGVIALTLLQPQRNRQSVFLMLSLFGLIVISMLPVLGSQVVERISSIGGESASFVSRQAAYEMIWRRVTADFQLLGVGMERYSLGYYDSEWLRLMYESGIFGVGVVLAFLGYLATIAWRIAPGQQSRTQAQIALLVVLTMLAFNMFGVPTLSTVRGGEMFMGISGLLLAIILAERKEFMRDYAIMRAESQLPARRPARRLSRQRAPSPDSNDT